MRPLKFRAWDNHDHKMQYIKDNLPQFRGWELMQFTGLTDCHGKEIYEGDMLKLWIGGDWQEGHYVVEDLRQLYLEFHRDDSYYCITKAEIVGNIYESPALLATTTGGQDA